MSKRYETEEARRKNAENVQRFKEKMDQLTRLEQAAYKERKLLGQGFDPYTPRERELAEAIRADLDRVLARADMLHQEIHKRLGSSANASNQILLRRFQAMPVLRYEIKPF